MLRSYALLAPLIFVAFPGGGAARAAPGPRLSAERAPIQVAQNYDEPPAVIPDAGGRSRPQPAGPPQSNSPTQGQDAASLLVRVDRLEDQVRTLNGQIQQLQFNQSQLQDELKKFQDDVDYRFRESRARGAAPELVPDKRADAAAPPASPGSASPPPLASGLALRGHEADDRVHLGAPPRPLGTLPSGGAAAAGPNVIPAPAAALGGSQTRPERPADSNAPLDLGSDVPQPAAGPQLASPSHLAAVGPNAAPLPAPNGQSAPSAFMTGTPPTNAREDFDLALVSFNNRQYRAAASGFQGFLLRHPNGRLTPDAVFYLGESYWRSGRTRQAAEQYLKLSTNYAKSPRAPESLLKLGLSLEKLGSRQQACASWEEIERKYPNAPAAIRASARGNIKRDQC